MFVLNFQNPYKSDICRQDEYFDCGLGVCLTKDAECNGFVDCLGNEEDEQYCGMYSLTTT